MADELILAFTAGAGAAIGAAVAWWAMRAKAAQTEASLRGQYDTELATLNERTRILGDETQRLRGQEAEQTAREARLRDEISLVRNDSARLEERAERAAHCEQRLAACTEQLSRSQEEQARLASQLTERTRALADTENRLQTAEDGLRADRQQMEQLHRQLREEGERSATLAEQAARLPDLERNLETAREAIERWRRQAEELQSRTSTAEADLEALREQRAELTRERGELARQHQTLATEAEDLRRRLGEARLNLDNERTQAAEKLALLQQAREELSNQFKALANEILEEKARRFTEQNQTNLGQLLEPLKTRLQEFQGKVEEVYVKEGKDRTALFEQVKQLMSLNQQLSRDAGNLTRALKGEAKAQGNWGELLLERVLETSGLRKGFEYDTQEAHTRDDGSRVQPDVVVHLPEDRHLIIDAKVSLTAYEEQVNAEDDATRENALRRHLDSVRAHIRGLSERNYQDLYGVKSPDFVLMFIPVEPAYMLAIGRDPSLWQDAWKRNVLLVSPGTLLFVLRTVAHLWRQEQQNRNAQEIARRGGELYDKLALFIDDLSRVGERLNQARDSYEKAFARFATGRGNVIRQAEMLKELGVKPARNLPAKLVEDAEEATGLPPPSEKFPPSPSSD